MVLGEVVRPLLERHKAGGRHDPRLTPGTSEQDLDPPAFTHLLRRAAHERADRRAEPFETQNIRVSTSAAYSATSTPEAALA